MSITFLFSLEIITLYDIGELYHLAAYDIAHYHHAAYDIVSNDVSNDVAAYDTAFYEVTVNDMVPYDTVIYDIAVVPPPHPPGLGSKVPLSKPGSLKPNSRSITLG